MIVALKWFLLPCLDRLCAPCLYDLPLCCPGEEPCLTLQSGCVCFRPSPPSASSSELRLAYDRVRHLELQLQSTRDFQGLVRRRMLERLDRLEEGRQPSLPEEEVEDETVALLGGSKEGKDEKNNDDKENPARSQTGATVCIGYNVRPECYVLFDEWMQEISRMAASCTVGHLGALAVRAPTTTLASIWRRGTLIQRARRWWNAFVRFLFPALPRRSACVSSTAVSFVYFFSFCVFSCFSCFSCVLGNQVLFIFFWCGGCP